MTVVKYCSGGFSLSKFKIRFHFISFSTLASAIPCSYYTSKPISNSPGITWEENEESLKSRGSLDPKNFRREKPSQGRLGNCSWLREEKKENMGMGHPRFLQLYKVFVLRTVRFYFYNIFERIVFRNEGQTWGCKGLWGEHWKEVVAIIKERHEGSLWCLWELSRILTEEGNMWIYTGDKAVSDFTHTHTHNASKTEEISGFLNSINMTPWLRELGEVYKGLITLYYFLQLCVNLQLSW